MRIYQEKENNGTLRDIELMSRKIDRYNEKQKREYNEGIL